MWLGLRYNSITRRQKINFSHHDPVIVCFVKPLLSGVLHQKHYPHHFFCFFPTVHCNYQATMNHNSTVGNVELFSWVALLCWLHQINQLYTLQSLFPSSVWSNVNFLGTWLLSEPLSTLSQTYYRCVRTAKTNLDGPRFSPTLTSQSHTISELGFLTRTSQRHHYHLH